MIDIAAGCGGTLVSMTPTHEGLIHWQGADVTWDGAAYHINLPTNIPQLPCLWLGAHLAERLAEPGTQIEVRVKPATRTKDTRGTSVDFGSIALGPWKQLPAVGFLHQLLIDAVAEAHQQADIAVEVASKYRDQLRELGG